jgi:hypothetical protein
MPAAKTKYLPLYVPQDVYTRLAQAAQQQERVPEQQAAWILRQALSDARRGEDDPPDPRAA